MKIGIAIAPLLRAKHIFPDLQQLLELLISSEIGIKHFEIHTIPDLFELEILKIFKASGATFSIHAPHLYSTPPLNFCSTNKEDIKAAKQGLETSIKWANELNATHIIIHPDVPKGDKKKAQATLKEHINYGLKLINKNQFILLENMPGKEYLFYSPKPMKKFIDSFNSKQLGICWDVGHAYIVNNKTYLSFPRILKSLIKEVHMVDVRKTGKIFTDHYPLGSGILDFKKIIQALKKASFNDLIVMEIIPDEASGIDISKKVLEKAIKEG